MKFNFKCDMYPNSAFAVGERGYRFVKGVFATDDKDVAKFLREARYVEEVKQASTGGKSDKDNPPVIISSDSPAKGDEVGGEVGG